MAHNSITYGNQSVISQPDDYKIKKLKYETFFTKSISKNILIAFLIYFLLTLPHFLAFITFDLETGEYFGYIYPLWLIMSISVVSAVGGSNFINKKKPMKKTLNEIRLKISKVANSLREDARYNGEMSDYGAGELEKNLEMFSLGIKAATDAYIEEYNKVLPSDTLYEVPKMWYKYFLENEVEYQEYLRLKKKFKNI